MVILENKYLLIPTVLSFDKYHPKTSHNDHFKIKPCALAQSHDNV